MFEKIRAKWDLKRRVGDLEEAFDNVDAVLQRHVRQTKADLELLNLDLKKLRGRVTGGLRKNGEEETALPDWEVIDQQIREGTYDGVS